MKQKILYGILSLFLGVTLMSCSDDDYAVATDNILSQVTTGQATVTASTAVTTGTVLDLSKSAASSYVVGTVYGTTADPTVGGSKVPGSLAADGTVTTTITGLATGQTYYYATYVTLQGKLTRYGEVKSFTATDAQVATGDTVNVTATKATLTGAIANAMEELGEASVGFLLYSNEADLQAKGIVVKAEAENLPAFSARVEGLLPSTTYYYIAYTTVGDVTVLAPEAKSFTTKSQVMEYVDLGLPSGTKWAKCNIGAEAEEEAGTLMGYGDQSGLNLSVDAADYANTSIAGTENDNLFNLKIDENESNKTVMPTRDQLFELISKTTQTTEVVNGITGVRFTAENGNSIFLPYTGYREGAASSADNAGYYWSGDINDENSVYSYSMTLDGGAQLGVTARPLGLAIRSVQKSMFKGLQASLSVCDPNWWPSRWGGLGVSGNADVTDYGTYTVTADAGAALNGVNVFVIDIYEGAAKYGADAMGRIDKITVDGNEVACDNSKIVYGDLEGNGNFRIEIYNDYGATAENSPIDKAAMVGQKVEVTFTLMRKSCQASMSISDPNWWPSSWAAEGNAGNATVDNTTGTYTVTADLEAALNGVNVFCVDVLHFKDVFGEEKLNNTAAMINKITIDGNEIACDNSKIVYGDLENNGNFRIEIYNDYGATSSNSPIDKTAMQGQKVEVTFTLGPKVCEASMSVCDPNWWPSVWGAPGNAGNVTVNGPGTYTVTADPGGAINGVNVFVIDILNGAAAYSAATAEITSITVDGKEVACDNSKLVYGDLEGNGNFRIEIYNDYGKTSGNSPIDKAAMQGQNVSVTFVLK